MCIRYHDRYVNNKDICLQQATMVHKFAKLTWFQADTLRG